MVVLFIVFLGKQRRKDMVYPAFEPIFIEAQYSFVNAEFFEIFYRFRLFVIVLV